MFRSSLYLYLISLNVRTPPQKACVEHSSIAATIATIATGPAVALVRTLPQKPCVELTSNAAPIFPKMGGPGMPY